MVFEANEGLKPLSLLGLNLEIDFLSKYYGKN